MCGLSDQTLTLILRSTIIKLYETRLTQFVNKQDKVYHIVEWSISIYMIYNSEYFSD